MSKASRIHAQDVLAVCKIFSLSLVREEWSYANLAAAIGVGAGEAHRAVDRCRGSQLITPAGAVSTRALRDLLVVAVPRIFYAVRGKVSLGLPTSVYAPSLAGKFEVSPGALPIVWNGDGSGEPAQARGESIEPIYPTVPDACRADPVVYELLALVDVVRVGSATERAVAVNLIEKRMSK